MASTFRELFDELKSAQERSPAHAALIAALENLEQRAQSLRSHRNRSKLPNVSARDRDALLELHRAVGNAAEQLSGAERTARLRENAKPGCSECQKTVQTPLFPV